MRPIWEPWFFLCSTGEHVSYKVVFTLGLCVFQLINLMSLVAYWMFLYADSQEFTGISRHMHFVSRKLWNRPWIFSSVCLIISCYDAGRNNISESDVRQTNDVSSQGSQISVISASMLWMCSLESTRYWFTVVLEDFAETALVAFFQYIELLQ